MPSRDHTPGPPRRLGDALVPYGFVVAIGAAVIVWLDYRVPDRRGLELAHPWALALVAGAAVVAWVGFHLRLGRLPALLHSRAAEAAHFPRGGVAHLVGLPPALRAVAVALLAVALARPQAVRREEVAVEGIDLLLVLDISRSMEERDLGRSRIEAARRVIGKFLEGRRGDRIGLVVFARQAMLACPPTLDYGALDRIVAAVGVGDLDPMGTAIGDALGVGLAALRRSDARTRALILLTDGDSNVITTLSPEEARDAAKARGVRVFTVLVGSAVNAAEPVDPLLARRTYATNPDLLADIAAATGGRFFRAPDAAALESGFAEVRQTLEKSRRHETRRIPRELFPELLTPALLLLLVEVGLGLTRLRRFP